MGKLGDILRKAGRALRDAAGFSPSAQAAPERPRRAPLRLEEAVSRRRRGHEETVRQAVARAWFAVERSTGLTAGVVAILVVTVGWAALSHFVRIPAANVTVARADALVDVDLAGQSIGDLPEMSFFSLPKSSIEKVVRESQPNVAEISFDRSFPDGLTVTLKSYPAQFWVREGGKDGVVTSNGVLVLRALAKQDLPELRVVRTDGQAPTQAFNYRKTLEPEDAARATELAERVAAAFPQAKLARVSFFPLEREFHAEVGTGRTALIFDADADFGKPLRALRFYASKKGDPIASGAWFYADLRVPEKIFSCPADKTRDCRKNLVGIYGHAYDYVAPGARAGSGGTAR